MVESPSFFEELSALDAFFLYAERDEAPLHIGAVYIFEEEPRVPGGRGAQGIADTLRERLHLVPRYRQKVRFRPFNVGHPVWVDDPDFNLDYHVRHAKLPAPGDDGTLRVFASRVLASRLDVARPLWELYVVEGLTGGRIALVNKVHHAMVDGLSSVDVGTLLFDIQPEQEPRTPQPWKPRPAPDALGLALSSLEGVRRLASMSPLALSPWRLRQRIPEVVRGAAQEAMASPWGGIATLALSLVRPGPQLSFNGIVGSYRRVHHVSVPLSALKKVKDIFAATVNDVVLAVVAEGMHRWLRERREGPPDAIKVFCPVSVRDPTERYSLGNRVSGMVVNLPVGDMPPVTRLARISAETGELKRSGQSIAASSLTAMTEWAPATLHALGSRIASEPRFGIQSRINLIVTNVPGPQVPFYTGGSKLLEVWPYVPPYHTLGLSVAAVSYNGEVHFGLAADRDLVPDLDRLAKHIEGASEEYVAIASRLSRPLTRPAKRTASARSGPAGGKPARKRRS